MDFELQSSRKQETRGCNLQRRVVIGAPSDYHALIGLSTRKTLLCVWKYLNAGSTCLCGNHIPRLMRYDVYL